MIEPGAEAPDFSLSNQDGDEVTLGDFAGRKLVLAFGCLQVFITGGALACRLGCGFVAARKPGKLPRETVEAFYALEYGTDSLQVHRDAVPAGSRVIVLDDVLATGGTAKAKVELVEGLGGEVVGIEFVLELTFLHGRDKLAGYDVHALVSY